MRLWLRNALWDQVPRDHRATPEALRRRQWVTGVVVVLGGVVLGLSLRLEPGSPWFYVASLGLSSIWALGAFASGPLHLGRIMHSEGLGRPVAAPFILGLALAGVFVAGALVVRQVPWLARQVGDVTAFVEQGSIPLIVLITATTGAAEELFFRGAVYAATPRHPVLVSTALYTLATYATGNVMLTFAAVVLGLLVGLQRRASGGIMAPIITHLTWSLTMLFALPLIFV
ncbi:CPBP family intramembrane glutamic endopeptidase [Nocardioides coralli]|uniref:CPBP family intramembrane glutamic endopeptidase n=1 Tax=Nocardioides coralli TaxID=2872154 RepID=UPI001CA447AC|nr:CPBP family intramembrane glutamic endopeptidase [Nocardioides coralli]QZY29039.1 CPBP family intramembrane metalloprotease [Nocardioides coralli]